jgi:hypothetical protein
MSCCQKQIGRMSNGSNGAASLGTTPTVTPVYAGQQGSSCQAGSVVSNAPFLTSPTDFNDLAPIVSVPVVHRFGRQQPNNQYVFRSSPPGVVQVQSPKVGRY